MSGVSEPSEQMLRPRQCKCNSKDIVARLPACVLVAGRFWFLSLVLYVFGRTTGSGNVQLQYNAFVKRSSRVRERVRGRGEVKLLNPGIEFVS